MINLLWLEIPMSRTIFFGPKDVRAIEVRLYTQKDHCHKTQSFQCPKRLFNFKWFDWSHHILKHSETLLSCTDTISTESCICRYMYVHGMYSYNYLMLLSCIRTLSSLFATFDVAVVWIPDRNRGFVEKFVYQTEKQLLALQFALDYYMLKLFLNWC